MKVLDDHTAMEIALEEAKIAQNRGEVPIGAIILDPETGSVIARNGNRTREHNDPTAHAEILVIREACQIAKAQRIPDLNLYVTLEPCAMCTAAISFARINKLIYGASDEKGGAIEHGPCFFEQSTCHHKLSIEKGILGDKSKEILQKFFQARR